VGAHNTANRRRQKKSLANRDGGALCHYCGQRHKLYDLTVDHVVPRSRGGSNHLFNLVLACRPCNLAKGSMPLEEYLARAA
jgi:5-methylcytosine-specific restriction endonuclease McrA